MRSTFLPYARPSISEREISYVAESLRNGWLTTGPKTREFEAALAQKAGVAHAVALSSCTAGLHASMRALGVGPGDEVVMPSLTFVAGANCVRHLGGVPVFADIERDTLCISQRTIEAVVSPRTKVIVPMHYAGNPSNVRDILAYAQTLDIPVLEDAAHAVGMLDAGAWAGASSAGAVYSFYATKNLAAGEGGMLLTNDERLADRVRILSLHGMDRDAWKRYTQSGNWRYDVTQSGYKYNFPDLCAAVALAQLERIDELQARRHSLAQRYIDAFAGVDGIEVIAPARAAGSVHSWCMFVVLIHAERAGIDRDGFIERMRERNIGTSVHYIPTHRFSAYRDVRAVLPNTEYIADRVVSLPLYPEMSDADADDVIDAARDACFFSREPLRLHTA